MKLEDSQRALCVPNFVWIGPRCVRRGYLPRPARPAFSPSPRSSPVNAKSVKPQKSKTPFFLLLGAIAVAGAGVLYMVTRDSAPSAIAVDPSAPPAEARGYTLGNENAPITIAEFADFECPGCAQFSALTKQDIIDRLVTPGLAKFVFYDFPLPIHPNTMSAHLAAACADDQGKFWEMHDQLFNGQLDWNTQVTSNPRKVMAGYVKAIGLNEAEWNQCFDAQTHVGRIDANKNLGIQRGVTSTPSVQIADRLYTGGMSGDRIKFIVDSLIAANSVAQQ